MTTAAIIIFGFAILQMVIALVNVVFREAPVRGSVAGKPLVSVLIPARNEEKNIGILLDDLVLQDYSNIEIIVFDDLSEDGTAGIVSAMSEKDRRIRIIRSGGLPEGWLGKNYACHMLAVEAGGKYLLFLDADVRIGNGIIEAAAAMSENRGLSLISIFPKQTIISVGEKISVPVMNYILLTLLPLIFVRRLPFSSMSAANGQFMFFDAAAYMRLHPHRLMKEKKAEDIETARYMKKKGDRIACLTGDSSITCRMYTGLDEAVNGFSKNIAAFFGGSIVAAFLFWLVTTFGIIPVAAGFDTMMTVTYLLILVTTRILVSWASEQSPAGNIFYMIPQQISMGIIIFMAFRNMVFKRFEWKGRKI